MNDRIPARRRRIALLACALLAAAPIAFTPALASAATTADNWWYDLYDVAQVHADGWTGDGVKLAVIDSQINPDLPVFEGRSLTVADGAVCTGAEAQTATPTFDAVHGSTVTATIIGNGTGAGSISGIAPDADVTFYGWGELDGAAACTPPEYEGDLSGFGWAVQRAIDDGAQIITTSVGAGDLDGDADVIANALAKGVVVVAASSNPVAEGEVVALGDNATAQLNGIVAASAVDREGSLQVDADGQPFAFETTTVVAAGADLPTVGVANGSWDDSGTATGSSLAAPLVAGMLAVTAQRYPEATANQLVQSLIHNTGREPHELEYDATSGYGYGAAWLTSMLAADPSQYPDESPLMNKSVVPTTEQVAAAEARGSVYPPVEEAVDSFGEYEDDPSASGSTSDAAGPELGLILAVVGGIVGLVVAAIVIVIVIVVSRKKKSSQGGTS